MLFISLFPVGGGVRRCEFDVGVPRVDYDEGYRRNIIDEPLESTVLESLRLAAFPAISPLFFFCSSRFCFLLRV